MSAPGDDGGAVALRAGIVQELSRGPGRLLLEDDTVQLRLRGPAGAPLDLAAVKALLSSADAAFAALDHERSLALLETAIEQLEADRDFSVEKLALLEAARVTCAQRLVGLGGPGETGRAETANGRRARVHLAQVLRARPAFALDPQRYPPKLRSLLALAAEDVKRAGMGDVQVLSTPPGATVFVDGRQLGQTPLVLHEGVPVGRYRLWLERAGARSFTRLVEVAAAAPVTVEVDVAFEGSLQPATLSWSPEQPPDVSAWQRLSGLLGVDTVALVGVDPPGASGGAGWLALVDGRTGRVVAGARRSPATPASLAPVLRGEVGDAGFTLPAKLDRPSPQLADGGEDGAPMLSPATWVVVGVVGGAAVVAAGALGAALVVSSTPPRSTFAVSVTEAP